MEEIQRIFTNREIAFIVWLLFIMVALVSTRFVRQSLAELVGVLFQKVFLWVFLSALIYLIPLVWFFERIDIWSTKDFVFWIFAVALVQIFNVTNAKKSDYFKTIIVQSVTFTVLVEFIINFYSFHLVVELLLLPILLLLTTLKAVSDTDKKYNAISKLLENIFAVLGFTFIGYSIYKTIINYDNFFTLLTLKDFVFPILLTIVFIPFLYFLALYIAYESYFIHLDFMTVKKEKVKIVKRLILRRANFSLETLNRIRRHFHKKVFYDNTDLDTYIKRISQRNS